MKSCNLHKKPGRAPVAFQLCYLLGHGAHPPSRSSGGLSSSLAGWVQGHLLHWYELLWRRWEVRAFLSFFLVDICRLQNQDENSFLTWGSLGLQWHFSYSWLLDWLLRPQEPSIQMVNMHILWLLLGCKAYTWTRIPLSESSTCIVHKQNTLVWTSKYKTGDDKETDTDEGAPFWLVW